MSKKNLSIHLFFIFAAKSAFAVSATQPYSMAQPPLPKSSGTIMGLDIYHDDDVQSWTDIATGGYKFIAVKATEGGNFADPNYAENRAGAKSVGLIFGAYHFVNFNVDPVVQADFFMDTINQNGGLAADDFIMLDWETASGDPHDSNDGDNVQIFLEEIKSKMGRRCFVYVSPSMVDEVGNPGYLAEYPLFLADYNSNPEIPAPYSRWNIWQMAGDDTIPGLGNPGDFDVFQGSIGDLKALVKYTNL